MFKLDLEKAEESRDQIANICWSIEKATEFQKNICFIDYTKAFNCVDHNKLENSSSWKYQSTLPASCEICMQIKKQQLETLIEGKAPRWRRSRKGKTLSPPQIHQKSI